MAYGAYLNIVYRWYYRSISDTIQAMRINKWIAGHTDLARRKVDELIGQRRIRVNGTVATLGQNIEGTETITIDGKTITVLNDAPITVLLNKPVGYVCSKDGQGSKTVYELLPPEYGHLNIAGRLDKDSSGLVVLSSDGEVIQQLTHPTLNKKKVYVITTKRTLTDEVIHLIQHTGVNIGDKRKSRFKVIPDPDKLRTYTVILSEGRNRQIRRTIEAVKNQVETLHRIQIGTYELGNLPLGKYTVVQKAEAESL